MAAVLLFFPAHGLALPPETPGGGLFEDWNDGDLDGWELRLPPLRSQSTDTGSDGSGLSRYLKHEISGGNYGNSVWLDYRFPEGGAPLGLLSLEHKWQFSDHHDYVHHSVWLKLDDAGTTRHLVYRLAERDVKENTPPSDDLLRNIWIVSEEGRWQDFTADVAGDAAGFVGPEAAVESLHIQLGGRRLSGGTAEAQAWTDNIRYELTNLPRFTLGQDFSMGNYVLEEYTNLRDGWVIPRTFCEDSLYGSTRVNELAPGYQQVLVDGDYVEDVLPQRDVCLVGLGMESSKADSLRRPLAELTVESESVSIIVPTSQSGLQALSWLEFIGQQALGSMPVLAELASSLPTPDHQAGIRDGFMYILEPLCAEQSDSVNGKVTFNYYLKSTIRAKAGGWPAGSFASLHLRADAWSDQPSKLPEHEFFRQSVSVKTEGPSLIQSITEEVGSGHDQVEFFDTFSSGLGASQMVALAHVEQLSGFISGAAGNVFMADEATGQGFGLLSIDVEFSDASAPAIEMTVDGPQGRGDWFRGPVTVEAAAADPQTCVDTLSLSGPPPVFRETDDPWDPNVAITYERQGVDTFVATATNHKGLSSSDDISVAIDSVAPRSSQSISGIGQNGWYRSCVDLTITTVDSTSGPAEQFSDRLGDGEVEAGSREFCAEGIEPFMYWAWDVAGNIEDEKEGPVLKIDRTPPDGGTGEYEGQEGYEDWYQSCVLVPILGWDALSGFDFAEYAINDGGFTEGDEAEVCDEGFNEVHVIAHDVAGNEDIQRSFEVKVDDTDPRVETSVPFLTVLGNPTQVSYEADDALSGLYGTIGVEMRYEPLLGEPTDFERVCTDESYESNHSGSCEVPLDQAGRYCFRTWAGDRALNVGVSEPSCTTYASL